MPTLPDDLCALFDGPHFTHVATLMPDGSPHAVAIWTAVARSAAGERRLFFTAPTSRKARNLERDPRVALSVVDFANPYRTGWVRGRAVERRDDAEELVQRLAQRYTSAPYPLPMTNVVYAV